MKLLSDNNSTPDFLNGLIPQKDLQEHLESSHKPEKLRNYKYWTLEDDEKLSKFSKEFNYDWKKIAVEFPQRTSADVEQRWRQRIDPNTKKTSWSKEEDLILENMHKKFGGKWKLISGYLPGRLPSSIKNRFYGKIFKQAAKPGEKVSEVKNNLFDEEDLVDSFLDLSDNEGACTGSSGCNCNSSHNQLNFKIG